MPTIMRTKIIVNTNPEIKKVRGFPLEKSRFRFLDDWTPKAAAHVLSATSIRDNFFSEFSFLSVMTSLPAELLATLSMKH